MTVGDLVRAGLVRWFWICYFSSKLKPPQSRQSGIIRNSGSTAKRAQDALRLPSTISTDTCQIDNFSYLVTLPLGVHPTPVLSG
ncbi:MAG: hypothetical protein JWO52_7582 [Gammaproteobacteria bacterium]|nr:hypothetical protein [Gammaproteobacteria bacterium]